MIDLSLFRQSGPVKWLRASRDSRWLAALILFIAGASVWGMFWPGIINWDTAQIVNQARHGRVVDWWSGLGTLMLREGFAFGAGIGVLWAGCVAANVVGLYGCLRLVLERTSAAFVTLLITVFPPVYGELASFSRGNAYMGFTLMMFAALARATNAHGRSRRSWLGAALGCAVLGGVCRQNGIVDVAAVIVFCGAQGHTRPKARVLATATVVLVATVGCFIATGLLQRAAGVTQSYASRSTMVYDLAAMGVQSGHDDFPRRALNDLGPGIVSPANTSLRWLRNHFESLDSTFVSQVATMNLSNTRLASREHAILTRAWLQAVSAQPMLYLKVRARLSEITLGLGVSASAATGGLLEYSGLANHSNFAHPLAFPARYRLANAWLDHFIGPQADVPLNRGWAYLALSFVLGTFVITRGARLRGLAVAFVTAALLNLAFLFFAAPSASFRYIIILPPLSLILGVFAVVPRTRRPLVAQATSLSSGICFELSEPVSHAIRRPPGIVTAREHEYSER